MAAEIPENIKLKIQLGPGGHTTDVWINGKRVNGIRRFEIIADAKELTRVRMDFYAEIDIEGEVFDDMFEAWQKLGVDA